MCKDSQLMHFLEYALCLAGGLLPPENPALENHMNSIRTGKLINTLRMKKGLTQKQLAEKINISDKAVSKWERGEGCPDVSIIPLLAKELDVEIENIMKGEIPSCNESLATDYPDKKIKNYDFTRPDKWGREDLCTVCTFFINLSQSIEARFAAHRNESCQISIASIDQLTNYEFQRSIPPVCFIYDYDYTEAGFLIEIDAEIGKALLKQNFEEFPAITAFDIKVLKEFYVEEIINLLNEALLKKFDNISEEHKPRIIKKFKQAEFNPSTMSQQRDQMCCLVSYCLKIGKSSGMINIQLSDFFMDTLRSFGFFGFNWKEPELQYLSEINSKKNENNLTVEFGRFSPDNVTLEIGKILVFDKKYYEPLNLIYKNKVIHNGEIVVIDEKFGMRILDEPEVPDITYSENDDYISIQLGACYHTDEEIKGIHEKILLELNSYAGYPSPIIKNGSIIAYGEIVVVDDKFGIRITEIKD